MLFNKATQTAGKKVGIFGLTFISKIYYTFLFFIFILMFIHAISLSLEAQDPAPGLLFIGEKFLTPTLELHEASLRIIETGLYQGNSGSFFKNVYNTILLNATLIFSILVIIFYLRVLSWLITMNVLWNSSMRSVGYVIAFGFFTIIQMLILGREQWYVPIWVYWTFLKMLMVEVGRFAGESIELPDLGIFDSLDVNIPRNISNITG